MPPVKKKRGRPPLDDDFDSYSTPRIAHIESGTSKTYRQPAYDDHSDDHHPNTDPLSQPQSILEQSMEVQMDCDEEGVEHIIPKVERPDTPVSVKNDSYDENDYNPTSPKENESDAYDTGLSSQVNIVTSMMNARRTQNNLWFFFLCTGDSDATRRSRMAWCNQNERLFDQRTTSTILGGNIHETCHGSDQDKRLGNEKGCTIAGRFIWHPVRTVSRNIRLLETSVQVNKHTTCPSKLKVERIKWCKYLFYIQRAVSLLLTARLPIWSRTWRYHWSIATRWNNSTTRRWAYEHIDDESKRTPRLNWHLTKQKMHPINRRAKMFPFYFRFPIEITTCMYYTNEHSIILHLNEN